MTDKEPKVLGTEEAIARLIVELMKTEKGKVKVLSDLDDIEIGVLSLLSTIGENMKIRVIKDFCSNFCKYRVSRFRLGRKEMVDIASFTGEATADRRKRRNIKDLFAGLR